MSKKIQPSKSALLVINKYFKPSQTNHQASTTRSEKTNPRDVSLSKQSIRATGPYNPEKKPKIKTEKLNLEKLLQIAKEATKAKEKKSEKSTPRPKTLSSGFQSTLLLTSTLQRPMVSSESLPTSRNKFISTRLDQTKSNIPSPIIPASSSVGKKFDENLLKFLTEEDHEMIKQKVLKKKLRLFKDYNSKAEINIERLNRIGIFPEEVNSLREKSLINVKLRLELKRTTRKFYRETINSKHSGLFRTYSNITLNTVRNDKLEKENEKKYKFLKYLERHLVNATTNCEQITKRIKAGEDEKLYEVPDIEGFKNKINRLVTDGIKEYNVPITMKIH